MAPWFVHRVVYCHREPVPFNVRRATDYYNYGVVFGVGSGRFFIQNNKYFGMVISWPSATEVTWGKKSNLYIRADGRAVSFRNENDRPCRR